MASTSSAAHTRAPSTFNKYMYYENKTRFFLIASSILDSRHRIIKIDRTAGDELVVVEDEAEYTGKQMSGMLKMLNDGNMQYGGLGKAKVFHGLLGFVRFTAGWYMVLIMKRDQVAMLGGHYMYHLENTKLVPISFNHKVEKPAEEQRLMNIFKQVDMSKNFYFSYTYDITSTLQENLVGPARKDYAQRQRFFNDRFAWNYHMMTAPFSHLDDPPLKRHWLIPIIHGYLDQGKVNVLGRTVYITLFARRSRHFAGARYLRRGANDEGNVANEVETEQIVSEMVVTPLYYPGPVGPDGRQEVRFNPNYTSYVQYRGSIPLYWSQDAAGMVPRPPIEISVADPFYTAASKHFDNLFQRYGAPVTILNLIKRRESVPRESILLDEYTQCVRYLNQFLPKGKKIVYRAWDMSRATRDKNTDVISYVEDIAEESIQLTGFFHSGPEAYFQHRLNPGGGLPSRDDEDDAGWRNTIKLQSGISRINCVDCLDRTNGAMFACAKRAFGHQLYALGIVESPHLAYSCPAVRFLQLMYVDHGDTIALQYTGSAVVNRVESYAAQHDPTWTSHSRDVIENIRRFYTNSLLDADKQTAINLFLGTQDGRAITKPPQRGGYTQWFHPEYLDSPYSIESCERVLSELAEREKSQFWHVYYRPRFYSSLGKHYSWGMNTSWALAGLYRRVSKDAVLYDLDRSPFALFRAEEEKEAQEEKEKGLDPKHKAKDGTSGSYQAFTLSQLQRVQKFVGYRPKAKNNLHKPAVRAEVETPTVQSLDVHSTEYIATQLLDPMVPAFEEHEYQGYIDQCQELSDSNITFGERKDHDIYTNAIDTALGNTPEWPVEIPKEFVVAVDRANSACLDTGHMGGRNSFVVTFNYEKWNAGIVQS